MRVEGFGFRDWVEGLRFRGDEGSGILGVRVYGLGFRD